MNSFNNIIIFSFLFLFLFATTTNSLPHNDLKKRAEDVGKYTQCSGTFPITIIEDTFTPAIIVPDKNLTEHIIFDSTVEITSEDIFSVTITHLDGSLIYSYQINYCKSLHKIPDVECPIPAGHYDYKLEYAVPSTPQDPKGLTVDFFAKFTLSKPDETILMCTEGKATISFP